MKIRVFRHGKRILSLLLVMVMVLTITPIQAKAGTGKYDVGRYVGLYSTSQDALSGYYVVFNVKGELIRSDQMESPALALTCWRALSEEDKRTVTKVFSFAPEERMQQFGYKGSKELTDFANEKGAWTDAWEKWADGIAKKNFGDLDSKLSDANYSTWVKQYKEINTDNYTEDAVKLLKSDNPKAKNIRAEYDFMCAYLDTARECYKAVAKAKVLQTQVAVKGISKELINLIMSNAVCPMLTPGSGITGAATLLGKYQSVANDVTGMVWDRLMSLKDAYVAMYDASRGQSEISARTLLDMYSNTIDTNLEIINMCMEDADRLKNDINSSADVCLQIIKDEEEETNNRVTKEKDSVDKIVSEIVDKDDEKDESLSEQITGSDWSEYRNSSKYFGMYSDEADTFIGNVSSEIDDLYNETVPEWNPYNGLENDADGELIRKSVDDLINAKVPDVHLMTKEQYSKILQYADRAKSDYSSQIAGYKNFLLGHSDIIKSFGAEWADLESMYQALYEDSNWTYHSDLENKRRKASGAYRVAATYHVDQCEQGITDNTNKIENIEVSVAAFKDSFENYQNLQKKNVEQYKSLINDYTLAVDYYNNAVNDLNDMIEQMPEFVTCQETTYYYDDINEKNVERLSAISQSHNPILYNDLYLKPIEKEKTSSGSGWAEYIRMRNIYKTKLNNLMSRYQKDIAMIQGSVGVISGYVDEFYAIENTMEEDARGNKYSPDLPDSWYEEYFKGVKKRNELPDINWAYPDSFEGNASIIKMKLLYEELSGKGSAYQELARLAVKLSSEQNNIYWEARSTGEAYGNGEQAGKYAVPKLEYVSGTYDDINSQIEELLEGKDTERRNYCSYSYMLSVGDSDDAQKLANGSLDYDNMLNKLTQSGGLLSTIQLGIKEYFENPNEYSRITSLSAEETEHTLKLYESKILPLTIEPENPNNSNIIWSSSSPGNVSVDSSGTVTGLAVGTAVITALAEDNEKKIWTKEDGTTTEYYRVRPVYFTVTVEENDNAAETPEYTINYDLQGGTGAENPESYTPHTDSFVLNNPEKEGYSFEGWTGSNGDTPQQTVTIERGSVGNRSYTANWKDDSAVGAQVYKITYDLNGGTVQFVNPTSYTSDTETFTLNNPQKDDDVFLGWTWGTVKKPQLEVEVEKGSQGNLSFKAIWESEYDEDSIPPDEGDNVPGDGNSGSGTGTNNDSAIKKGTVEADKDGTAKYKVTNIDSESGTVEVSYKAAKSSTAKVTIPKTVTLADGTSATVTAISDNAFANNKKLTTVTIPDTVETIGNNAFKNCVKLKKVNIPKNVKNVGKNAYAGCSALTKVTVKSNSLTKIDQGAFKNCKKLISFTVPKSVTTIGEEVFSGDKKLKTVTIKSTKVKTIGKNAFKNINKKATIKVPKKLTKKQLAKYKKMLNKAGVPKTVKIKKG